MITPTNKQKLALYYLTDNVTEFVGYGGAAGGGKTYIGCLWLMQMCYYAAGTRYFIGRDNIKQTRESVAKTWRKLATEIGLTGWIDKGDCIVFDNGSEIEFLDLSFYPIKDPMYEALGSKEYTCGWIEEASGVHSMAIEVLKSRVGRWMNKEYNIKKKILCTFNPKKNWVDTMFYRQFVKGEQEHDTKFVYALPTDNPYLPEDYLNTLRGIKDRATRERLLNGNFDYDDNPNAMIEYGNISAIFSNDHVIKDPTKFIVGDIARYGSDKAIITVWAGWVLIEKQVFATSSIVELQNCISALRARHQIPAYNCLVDEDGVGGGVVDNLKIKGFVNNSRPLNPVYRNIKHECAYKLAENIGLIYVECEVSQKEREEIEQELGQLMTYEADKDGKLRTLPKEIIKANIGRSPDWLDVFIMRMRFALVIQRSTTKYVG